MKKLSQLTILALLLPFLTFSQVTVERDVLASAGEYSATASLSLSWTVGELAVTSMQVGNLVISQGFQQADKDLTGIHEISFPGEINVFPNPTTDILYFEIQSESPLQLRAELFDLLGKRVILIPEFRVNQAYEGQLDCSTLPAGKWLLRFYDPASGAVKSFTVIKLR
jgi:hypothetical protein